MERSAKPSTLKVTFFVLKIFIRIELKYIRNSTRFLYSELYVVNLELIC